MRIHISLQVSDLEASLDFYTGLLGQAPSKTREDYANFRLDQPPIHLALVTAAQPGAAHHEHYGIELEDHAALNAWRERFKETGLIADEEPGAKCCYAIGDKLWLKDPDGHRWEIWVRTGEYQALASNG